MIAIHKDKSFKVKVSELGKDTFKGIVIESDMKVYQLNYYGITWNKQAFDFFTDDEVKDTIVESVINQFKQRSELGIKKYNTTLDRNDLKPLEWLQHFQEELMDAILYLERLKKEL
jgi:hypothetical protein